jgi:predicted transcriptional regulator
MIRASLAEKLAAEGFHVKEIAGALNVAPAAVTQYLKLRRGTNLLAVGSIGYLIVPLAERVARSVRPGREGSGPWSSWRRLARSWPSTQRDRS